MRKNLSFFHSKTTLLPTRRASGEADRQVGFLGALFDSFSSREKKRQEKDKDRDLLLIHNSVRCQETSYRSLFRSLLFVSLVSLSLWRLGSLKEVFDFSQCDDDEKKKRQLSGSFR